MELVQRGASEDVCATLTVVRVRYCPVHGSNWHLATEISQRRPSVAGISIVCRGELQQLLPANVFAFLKVIPLVDLD